MMVFRNKASPASMMMIWKRNVALGRGGWVSTFATSSFNRVGRQSGGDGVVSATKQSEPIQEQEVELLQQGPMTMKEQQAFDEFTKVQLRLVNEMKRKKRTGSKKVPGRKNDVSFYPSSIEDDDDDDQRDVDDFHRAVEEYMAQRSEQDNVVANLLEQTPLKPQEIVDELEKHIVGQTPAKRSVAVALRNRWRRLQLDDAMKDEVFPKNILMIGPTGCGKTEIARRLAKLSQAPFVKVEATKFTEVGFHGRDVDKIISDLVETSMNLTKQLRMDQEAKAVAEVVEKKLLDAISGKDATEETRASFLDLLRQGKIEDQLIVLEVPVNGPNPNGGAISFDTNNPAQLNQVFAQIGKIMGNPTKKEEKQLKVSEARKILTDMEMENRIDSMDVTRDAIHLAEQNGIVFIDEIDKICSFGELRSSADASAEGVQRDLLPLIEGCVVNTKHGNVNTKHILFIASGAFHACAPSDLLPELQGRLPIRVELDALTEKDLYKILTEPQANLIAQQVNLLRTEGVELVFDEDAVREMARIAAEVNNSVENIGARRLHTIIEKIVEEVSFYAPEIVEAFRSKQPLTAPLKVTYDVQANPDNADGPPTLRITRDIVKEKISDLLKKSDFDRFIL